MRGFTLIELLVTITIIAVLSTVGVVAYQNVSKTTRDNRRIQDVSAIAKSLESKYPISNKYVDLTSSDMDGGVPKDPRGNDYFRAVTNDGKGFKICAALDANTSTTCNTPATNCFCKASQLSSATNTSSSNLGGSTFNLGWGGSTSASCDTNGTLAAGLVGYWKLDEGTGTTTTDSSNNGNTLTLTNGPAWAGAAQGKSGNALTFSGTNQWAYINPGINLPTGDSARTLTAWIKPTVTLNDATYNGIVAYGTDCTRQGMLLSIRNNSTISTAAWCDDLSQPTSNPPLVSNNSWNFAAVTYDPSANPKRQLLVDGTVVASDNMNNPPNSSLNTGSSYLRIGSTDTPGRTFTGTIDEVRIYSRALTQPELSLLASGCISP